MATQTIDILSLPVAVSLDGTEYTPLVQGLGLSAVTRRATTKQISGIGLTANLPGAIEWVIDGAGGNIASKIWGNLEVTFNGILTSAVLTADQTGSIIVDVWRCTFAQYNPPATPTSANSITGGNPPTLSSASKSSSTLPNWNTQLNIGDILTFQVPAPATNITRVTLALNLIRVLS